MYKGNWSYSYTIYIFRKTDFVVTVRWTDFTWEMPEMLEMFY